MGVGVGGWEGVSECRAAAAPHAHARPCHAPHRHPHDRAERGGGRPWGAHHRHVPHARAQHGDGAPRLVWVALPVGIVLAALKVVTQLHACMHGRGGGGGVSELGG